MSTHSRSELSNAREGIIPVENGGLYYRAIGEGQPVLILPGGPDFDHTYLLPDLDRLSDSFRLIYNVQLTSHRRFPGPDSSCCKTAGISLISNARKRFVSKSMISTRAMEICDRVNVIDIMVTWQEFVEK